MKLVKERLLTRYEMVPAGRTIGGERGAEGWGEGVWWPGRSDASAVCIK